MLVPEWCLGFSFFFFWCFGTSSPELSIDELRCRFFGVVHGVEGVSAVTGGDGLAGGEFNGSGGGMGPFFFGTKTDMRGGGMDFWSGVVGGGRMMRGCFGDDGVE